MFFYEWVVPFILVVLIIAAVFYVSVRNRSGAGIRTDGHTVFHKDNDENSGLDT